jgi:hypothetical protein
MMATRRTNVPHFGDVLGRSHEGLGGVARLWMLVVVVLLLLLLLLLLR